MPFGFKSDELNMICAVFREFPAIDRVVIFGSRAMGNFKPGSDVDLAIEGRLTDELLAQVRTRLNEELPLPYVFDVFDRAAIRKEALREHIREFGKAIYER